MIADIAIFGFALAAAAFAAVAVVLAIGWQGNPRAIAPLAAVVASVVWGAGLAALHLADLVLAPYVAGLDALRLAGWFGLLLVLLSTVAQRFVFRILVAVAALIAGGELALALASVALPESGGAWAGTVPALCGIAGAVLGLVLIEQIYRNAAPEGRWALKYLCVGLGAMFVYDLFVFADAVLMSRPDAGLWAARGYISALVAPLIAVSAARNPGWSLDVYVSRSLVLHTASLALAGGYLVAMAAVAWSIRAYGGAWAGPVQAVFLVGSILVLAILLFSGQIRARARVFVSKHFYNYRYDYREEWLRFSRTMTGEGEQPPLRERVIQGIAQVVESSGGALWQVRDGELVPVASWNVSLSDEVGEPLDGELARFIAETEWVLTVDEWQRDPDRYRNIALPSWLQSMPRAWLLVPLLHHDRLQGFVVLTRSMAGRGDLNWEDFDLLKIIGRQAASYLAQEEAAQALSRAQQFETFSRLSAFVLHDLKNVIGQLSMLARNARRHRDSPEFMADAVDTLEHSVERMNQLMNQLRGGVQAGTIKVFDLGAAVQEAVSLHTNDDPVPRAELRAEGVRARADRGRLVAVLGNLIQNACEATAPDGSVRVVLRRSGDSAIVDVVDTGTGMDQDFIRNRLFRPFDTSKGTTGMGIGAFEAREFARGLGGDLEVSSVPGEGTRFSLYVPRQVLVESGPESAIETTP